MLLVLEVGNDKSLQVGSRGGNDDPFVSGLFMPEGSRILVQELFESIRIEEGHFQHWIDARDFRKSVGGHQDFPAFLLHGSHFIWLTLAGVACPILGGECCVETKEKKTESKQP